MSSVVKKKGGPQNNILDDVIYERPIVLFSFLSK